jgi:exopolyphosphatase/guanosine-5'-triphosphate,3'-diphosphate pyrophosphatase
MLWVNADEAPGTLKWRPKSRELTLKLSEHARPLFGEVAEARFAGLASVMDATSSVKFTK